jgi:hypothetical protein
MQRNSLARDADDLPFQVCVVDGVFEERAGTLSFSGA